MVLALFICVRQLISNTPTLHLFYFLHLFSVFFEIDFKSKITKLSINHCVFFVLEKDGINKINMRIVFGKMYDIFDERLIIDTSDWYVLPHFFFMFLKAIQKPTMNNIVSVKIMTISIKYIFQILTMLYDVNWIERREKNDLYNEIISSSQDKRKLDLFCM